MANITDVTIKDIIKMTEFDVLRTKQKTRLYVYVSRYNEIVF